MEICWWKWQKSVSRSLLAATLAEIEHFWTILAIITWCLDKHSPGFCLMLETRATESASSNNSPLNPCHSLTVHDETNSRSSEWGKLSLFELRSAINKKHLMKKADHHKFQITIQLFLSEIECDRWVNESKTASFLIFSFTKKQESVS